MQHRKNEKESLVEVGYDDMTKFENFVIANWKIIMRVSFGFVIAVALVMIFMKISNANSNKVSAELGKAQTIEKLKKVLAVYPNHPSAELAKMRLACLYINDKKYDEALKIYKELSKSQERSEIAPRSRLDEFYTLEMMGKKEEASAGFAEAGKDMTLKTFFRDEANYNAARIYNSEGNKEKAKANLDKINLAEGVSASNFWISKAKALKESL